MSCEILEFKLPPCMGCDFASLASHPGIYDPCYVCKRNSSLRVTVADFHTKDGELAKSKK